MFRENENTPVNSNKKSQLFLGSISDIEIRKLRDKITELETENNSLKKELLNLNENTIVESMNDMKIQFQELKENSINVDDFDNLKDYYIRNFEISKSIKTINQIMIDNLMEFKHLTNDQSSSQMVENRITRYVDKTMHYYQLINDICSRYDGDDYIDPRFTES
jgi:hypothetical protein